MNKCASSIDREEERAESDEQVDDEQAGAEQHAHSERDRLVGRALPLLEANGCEAARFAAPCQQQKGQHGLQYVLAVECKARHQVEQAQGAAERQYVPLFQFSIDR